MLFNNDEKRNDLMVFYPKMGIDYYCILYVLRDMILGENLTPIGVI